MKALTEDLRKRIELGVITAKRASIQVMYNPEVHTQRTCITESFHGSKDKGIKCKAFKTTLQDRVGSRLLKVKGLHHVSPETLEMFPAHNNSRNGVHRSRPSNTSDQNKFLSERAPS
jgi:hypothetical protein